MQDLVARQQLLFGQEPALARLVLFGWLFNSAGSLDIVISAAVPQDQILQSFATLDTLQTAVLSSNKRMPVSLQESATFTILGDCGLHLPGKLEEDCCSKQEKLPLDAHFVQKEQNGDRCPSNDHSKWGCDYSVFHGFLDTCRKSAIKDGNWLQFFCKSGQSFKSNLNQVPVLHHLYLDGEQIEINHCHVILYDVPTIGRNHFSLCADAPCKLKASFKKPNWINDLQKKPLVLDLDPIVLALNCSNAARLPVAQECATGCCGAHLFFSSIFDALVQVTWHCIGLFSASASTILYIMILMFEKYLSHISQYLMLQKVFRHSWSNIHLRSCQILYWPIVLQDTSISSSVNVEYAHKAAMRRHVLWSNIVVDLVMGFVLGVAFLLNIEAICAWTIALVRYMQLLSCDLVVSG